MTLVWVSPELPADRTELASFLPSDIGLVPLRIEPPEAVFELPVGSLCVATVFEPDVLARLAERPQGVGLLVVGPEGHPGLFAVATDTRPADVTTSAGSVGELAAAIRRAVAADPAAAPVAATVPERTPKRSKLIAVAAVLAGLAVGGVVIAATESSQPANASANAGSRLGAGFGGGGGGFGGLAGPPGAGGQQAGPGSAGGQAPGSNFGAFEQELLTCLRQQGITTPTNQLLPNSGDPKLRQAFFTCVQQLGLSGRRGGRGLSSQLPGRP